MADTYWSFTFYTFYGLTVELRATFSKVPWLRAYLHFQRGSLFLCFIWERKYCHITGLWLQLCVITHVSSFQEIWWCSAILGASEVDMRLRHGGIKAESDWCSSWPLFWGLSLTPSANYLWGCSRNSMVLSWRARDKVVTSSWIWGFLGGRSIDVGNRLCWGCMVSVHPQFPVSVSKSMDIDKEFAIGAL